MKKIYFLFLFSVASTVFSQEDAWVYFNSKPNSQYYLNNPLQMLSQRALDRRATQNIALDLKDVPIHQPYIDEVATKTGITIKAKSKWMNCLHVRGSQLDINALLSLSYVDHIQFANHSLDLTWRTSGDLKNNSYDKFQDFLTDFNYGNSNQQIQMLNAQVLHQENFTGTGKIIAIMDAGFPGVNTTSPFKRLRDNNQILGGYDFVGKTSNPYVKYQHGTQVLSNMGGFVDGQLVGTAPDASYYLFITEDVNSENPVEESNWVEAAEMADNFGVDVINTSLGYFDYDNPAYSYKYSDITGNKSFISRGANIAFSRGMICVTSAGNSGGTSDFHIAVPADAASTLTVGAVNSSRSKAGFSSVGPTFDGRQKPDVMAMGVSAVVATQTGSVSVSNGTSFSSPILAGAVASFWSAFPNKTNAEIVQLVKQSSDRYPNPDNSYGFGIPNFQTALNNARLLPDSNSDFVLFPKVVVDNLILKNAKSLIGNDLKLYNSLGQLVLDVVIDSNIQQISMQNLVSGIYFYSIADKKFSGKLIKE